MPVNTLAGMFGEKFNMDKKSTKKSVKKHKVKSKSKKKK